MRRLLILLVLLFCQFGSVHADDGRDLSPCLPAMNTVQSVEWLPTYRTSIYSPSAIPVIYALSGEQVQWLGYASDQHPELSNAEVAELERAGQDYGFADVNLNTIQIKGELFLLQDRSTRLMRLLVTFDPVSQRYILFATTPYQFARADGTRYDYHGFNHPHGGICMWWLNPSAFRTIIRAFLPIPKVNP